MYVKEFGFEIKSTNLEFKDIDSKTGIVIGYFSAFGNKDSDGDVIVKGFYKKTIEERGPKSVKPRIKHLLDHNKTHSVALIQELEEDSIGLKYQSKAGRHTNGQDWLKMCEDGLITEHSVGFETKKKSKEKDATYLHEGILWEGTSMQCWGANENTPIAGFKSYKVSELHDRFAILDKAMRTGTYSDDTFITVIEPELKHIKRIIDNLTDATTQPEPEAATIEPDTKKNLDLIEQLKSINQIFKQN